MDGADPGDAVPESGVRLEKGGRAWAGAGVCTGGRGTRAAGSSLFCVQCLSQSRWTGQQPGFVYWIKHSREDDSWLLKVQHWWFHRATPVMPWAWNNSVET